MGNALVCESCDGYRWYVREHPRFSHDGSTLQFREISTYRALRDASSKDKVFVDIGSHVGYYTVRLAKYYKKVVAIEPNPYSIQALKENIRLNNLTNVEVIECACGDVESEAVLYDRGAMATLLPVVECWERIKVKVKPLDDLVEKADVIKIDAEAYEEKILLGAKRILSECKPVIIIEHHDFRGYNIDSEPRIRNQILRDYWAIELNTIHCLYIPKGVDLSPFKQQIADVWIKRVLDNIQKGLPWYYGLPHTWWWGFEPTDFFAELPNHVVKEKEWLEGAVKR